MGGVKCGRSTTGILLNIDAESIRRIPVVVPFSAFRKILIPHYGSINILPTNGVLPTWSVTQMSYPCCPSPVTQVDGLSPKFWRPIFAVLRSWAGSGGEEHAIGSLSSIKFYPDWWRRVVLGVSHWVYDRLTWRSIDWLSGLSRLNHCQSTDWLEYMWST